MRESAHVVEQSRNGILIMRMLFVAGALYLLYNGLVNTADTVFAVENSDESEAAPSQERPKSEYQQWCEERGVSHAHCPEGCEHPQPFVDEHGELVCGTCVFEHGERCVMIPCTPDTCD